MGWKSWNHFHCRVNDSVIRGAADAMVVSTSCGLLGYGQGQVGWIVH